MAMAPRSLALRLKALPLRAPASSRAFTTKPKGDISSEIVAALKSKEYDSSTRDVFDNVIAPKIKQAKFAREQYEKRLNLRGGAFLLGLAGIVTYKWV